MEDLKIKVNGNIDELVDLLKALGCKYFNHTGSKLNYMFFENGSVHFCKLKKNFEESKCKEVTISELKDLVVLKRNNPKDATHKGNHGSLWYLGVNKYGWRFDLGNQGEWELDDEKNKMIDWGELKPIKEEVMKEFLNPEQGYSLVSCYVGKTPIPESWIEIPEGANFYCDKYFWMQLNSQKFWNGDNWQNDEKTLCNFSKSFDIPILWQREKESIIDKLVVDEVKRGIDATLSERQAQYGCFEDVAFVSENIMSILSKVRSNGLQDLPHTHRMALYMIASKMSRIVNGDFNHKDSWHDIGGYAKLIEDLI